MTMTAPTSIESTGLRAARAFRSYGIVGALALLVAAITIAQPGFLAYGNLMNILSQWAPVAIMGIGMTYVVITGGFDLSVGAIYSLCAVTAAAIGRTEAPVVAFTVAILAGMIAGAANGFVVTGLRVNPFIATLGTSLIISGVTLVLTGNAAFVVDFEPFTVLGSGRLLGVPYSGMLMVALMIVAGFVLSYTPFGQSIYAVGGNAEASRLAGIRTSLVTGSSYAISGLAAGIAGVITASQLSSAQPNLNPNLVFDVLTVVIVGGTSLTGGRGAIWRTAIGVAILATLQNGFNLLDVDAYYQNIIKGVIIIAALATVDWHRFVRPRSGRRPSTTDL
ncbi:ABC transporter permease [Cryobacterium algoritolerans]|uniref:ABC transporter permease n=1 Tax=Cryobacterium algoritolerans TaxID=1259184 RepID=A0A4R8WZV6_9MICO|nr:ABC transporter permease [Cryobacterium algoritolerans]TFC19733.1 ABC transporter permease [Cryobacterium algoritolerans]